jgi:ribosomal protein L40E
MRCHNCSTRNPEGAEVCVRCSSPLRRTCPKCGFENPPEAPLCAQCATTFTVGAAVPGEQRPAAARSAGIKESTELKQDLNPEARAIIAPALDLMKDAVLRYEIAALLAHRHEEAREIGAAVRWHQRAAEWAGIGDINAALPHWQKMRELARQCADVPQTAALRVVACSKALAHGCRLGASATDWEELFE